jgi:hypothetical protein
MTDRQASRGDTGTAARRLTAALGVWALGIGIAAPATAAPVDELMQALRLPEMIEVMRAEGLAYGTELGQDLFAGGTSARWEGRLSEVYDTEKMMTVVRGGFTSALQDTDIAPLLSYFESETGQRIVELELEARRAMVEDDVEQAARESYRAMQVDEDPRLDQVARFIAANDLLEANVTGALNASFQFYSGLVDGGGMQMTEADILSDVWAQEEETRFDTEEWLNAFLLMAYAPLEDEVLDTYIDISSSREGKALNRALFTAFNGMYDELSYGLGLVAAQEMQGQDL